MIVTTSWDDGDVHDERLADLLDRFALRATFYIARRYRTNTLPPHRIRDLAKRHEIGAHTVTHPDLTSLGRGAKIEEIEGSKKWLEDVTGDPVTMFCYPFGQFDLEVKELVAAAGFTGARTTRQFVLRPDSDGLSMPTTLQVYPRLLRRCNLRDFIKLLSTGSDRSDEFSVVRSIWGGWSSFGAALLHGVTRDDRVFHLWGHSWEINEFDLWRKLEMFLGVVKTCAQETATNGSMIKSSRMSQPRPAEVPRAASSG